jgi:DNA-binding NarL/FixJ family response regulator
MLCEVDAREKLLIVEDEASLLATLVRTTETYFIPILAGSKALAVSAIDKNKDLAAAIVDVGLPDGDGLDLVDDLRKRVPDMPVLVLTGSNDPSTINRAQLLRAEYVVKPFFTDNVARFVQRALAHRSSLDKDRLSAQVAQISSDHRLSQREAQILIYAVEGVPRRHIADVLKVSENTVKTQVRSLLDKLGKETLSEAVWWVRGNYDTPARAAKKH